MKLIKLICLSVLVLLFAGAIYQFIPHTESVTADHHLINSSIETMKYDHISKYPGIDLHTETEETDTYTIAISIPTSENEQINAPIHTWIEQQKNNFITEVYSRHEVFKDGFIAHLNIQLETNKFTDTIYTLLFTSYEYLGGANGQQTIKPFTIDVEHQKLLHIDDLIDLENENTTQILRSLIKEKIKQDHEISFYVFEDVLDETLEKLDEIKWSINKESFIVYFDEYEIAAGAAGVIALEISLDDIQAYVKKEFIERQELREDKVEDPLTEEEEKEIDPDGKYIALTFDDGPNPDVTPRILESLTLYDAKATFFMLGNQVEYYPTVAKQVAEAGHEVASHSNSHSDMTKLGIDSIKQEINQTSKKIEEATGSKPTLFRPPYGAYDNQTITYLKNNGYSIILWSVDSLDWKNRDATKINELILDTIKDGAIVLMHDIHPTTADALPQLLTSLTNEGYKFITVSELLSLQDKNGIGPFFCT